MNADEIADRLAPLFGQSIQEELEGIVVLNEDGTNPAEGIPYTIPVRIEDQSETTYVKYDPLADATAFADGSPVKLHYNEDGELEARFDARRGRQAYGGAIPTRNMLFMQHTHESPHTGGKLAADRIFDSGTIAVTYGGIGIGSVTAGYALIGAGTAALIPLAPGSAGNAMLSDGTAWYSAALPTTPNYWTYSAPHLHPNNTTDRLIIGGTATGNKFEVVGVSDQVQLKVTGATGQSTNPVAEIADETGVYGYRLWNDGSMSLTGDFTSEGSYLQQLGAVIFNNTAGDYDTQFKGDNDTNLLRLDASTDSIGIGTAAPTDWLHLKASTTARASTRYPSGTAPTSPNDGARWNDSTRKAMMTNIAGNTGSDLQGLFTQTALTGSANTTAAVSMFGTGVTSRTLAANFFTVGKTLEIEVWGIYQTNGARDIAWELKAGSTVLVSQSTTSHNSGGAAARFWRGRFAMTCYTTGASGTFWTQGEIILHDGQLMRFFNSTTNVLDTTTSHALDLTWQYASSSSTTNAYAGIVSIKEIN